MFCKAMIDAWQIVLVCFMLTFLPFCTALSERIFVEYFAATVLAVKNTAIR